jgi:LmbE family N-acetylglucosaminyl deacetylase
MLTDSPPRQEDEPMSDQNLPLTLLIIGAHPADIFDQSGGTMAHHARRGDRVACAVLTHGARVHDAVVSDQMFHRERVPEAAELQQLMTERADVKAEEVRRACSLLGCEELYFMGLDDAVLLLSEEAVKQVASLVRRVRPHVVLTHIPREGSTSTNPHAIAGQIALYGMQLAGSVDPGDTNPPHKVSQTFFFGTGGAPLPRDVWGAQGGYYNDVFIDITDVVEDKLAALDALVSQGYGGAYARKRIETSDGAFGGAVRCAYAEGFIKMNAECHYHLPVTGHALELANLSDHQVIGRASRRHDDQGRSAF